VPTTGATFPLVPRFRLLGLPFGSVHSARRGLGSDIAGSRPYLPGDDVSQIDWAASAKLSAVRDTDEFVVRERFAEEAPRVIVVADRRPAMGVFPPELPWLEKPRALHAVCELVADSTWEARGFAGYLDFARGEAFWRPPQSRSERERLGEDYLGEPAFRAPADTLERALEFLLHSRRSLPPGTFVFVVSDFLVPPQPELWSTALEYRWDVVPVIVQDPVWEQSFPDVTAISLPLVDAESGEARVVRLGRRRAAAHRRANEERLGALTDELVGRGIPPVLVSSAEREQILEAFLEWGEERRALAREWRWRG
jgi:uncharacterized protein (DUF58 family)